MRSRTRYFLFGSVAVLLVGLCTGLVAYYAGLPIGALGQSDTPSELTYVPADAAVVAYCNVQEAISLQEERHEDRLRESILFNEVRLEDAEVVW